MRKIVVLLALLVMQVYGAQAQLEVDEAKAKFIYNFTKFFEWPETEKSGDFVVGVLGSKKVFNELTSFTKGKKVIRQNIVVKYFRNIDEADNCHLIYVSKYRSKDVKDIYKKTGHHTLIVSDSMDGIENGSALNFILEGNRLKFEFDGENAHKHGLIYNTSIKQMAVNG